MGALLLLRRWWFGAFDGKLARVLQKAGRCFALISICGSCPNTVRGSCCSLHFACGNQQELYAQLKPLIRLSAGDDSLRWTGVFAASSVMFVLTASIITSATRPRMDNSRTIATECQLP
ncbi:hypothetical protein CA54_35770 [Symmachiella macrocystis]|uniref:Uncharacterized protein n=1 Tax=Symmachiella macrocystis TaxID=2527985 RepID=A0A5C6BRM7_9PLAN|nr:hypothetical protein CA54_35770 [Symmachiella macrocystis]